MPFIYNDSIKFKNPIPGNPVLFVQGTADTIDGHTFFSVANYRPITFSATEDYTDVDGHTSFDNIDYRPITQQP